MTFLWSGFLYLLALSPALVIIYVWILRRRRRFAVHYSSLSLLRDVSPRRSQWRRHLPFGLYMIALAGLVLALSRPVSIVTVPAAQTTIILAIDVSRSMCSTDIEPTRLQAAEAAATAFIQTQRPNTQIGIVAFAGFAELIQPPTSNRDALEEAIQSLLTGRRTAIGSGILKSLDAIAEVDKTVAPSLPDTSPEITMTPVPKGAYAPDIIVLLTDGVSNTGPLPLDAAQRAVDRGVRVYTIGFGTASGSELASCQSSDPSGFGGFGGLGGGFAGGGGAFRRGIDELTLKHISDMTGGTYYPASSARELDAVFQRLPTYLIAKHETSEVSVFFAAGGTLLAAVAIALSFAWHPLP
jgi:Ca-activated chloride channel family protein